MINGQEKPTYELWHQRPLNQNNIASWHQESPLGRAEILDIAQDSIGYIWLASSEGLIRFDGYKTKVFDLSTDLILERERFNQVVYGSDGRLWFSNNSNLYYYDQRRIQQLLVTRQHNLDYQ